MPRELPHVPHVPRWIAVETAHFTALVPLVADEHEADTVRRWHKEKGPDLEVRSIRVVGRKRQAPLRGATLLNWAKNNAD